MAGVFAFYSIEALIQSYNHRVRTASYITVNNYSPVGIALFLQVSQYLCGIVGGRERGREGYMSRINWTVF